VDVEAIAREIVDAGVRLHKRAGPGLLESVYQRLLGAELERRGLSVEHNKVVSFTYDGMEFEAGLRIDMLVGGKVVVELKSVEKLAPVHSKQLLTYLRLLNLPLGLLMNFGGATLREGLRRIINKIPFASFRPLRVFV
jgi:GxxExxY protein